MARKLVGEKSVAFVYDFPADGGAISTIGMGQRIPNNAVIQFGFAKVITTLTSGGAATIAVGRTGATGELIAALAVASWTAGTIIEGVDLIVAMIESPSAQLAVTIAGDTITAGRFIYVVSYIEIDE